IHASAPGRTSQVVWTPIVEDPTTLSGRPLSSRSRTRPRAPPPAPCSASAAFARSAPLQVFSKQPFALGRRDRLVLRLRARFEEPFEPRALACGLRRHVVALEPFLRRRETLPTRHRRGQIGLRPVRMARRLLNRGEPRKE